MQISNAGLAHVTRWEGCKLRAYRCEAGVLTIGFGHTGADVTEGLTISAAQAEALLRTDLEKFEKGVTTACAKLVLTQGQFDALVSFAFNVGAEAFRKSTLLKLLKAGDTKGAAEQFARWTKAGSVTSKGLVARREAERKLFLS